MMNTKYYIVAILLSMTAANVSAQATDKTAASKHKEMGQEFVYNNKPISPEVLIPFFPSPVDSSSQKTVDLSHALLYRPTTDSVWVRGLKWVNAVQERTAYTCSTDFGFVNYVVLSNPAINRFVLLSCLNNGGTFTQVYTFVVAIRGDKLIKNGSVKTDNVKEFAIDVRDNTIYYDKASYPITSLTK